jgi:hypothetical protein
LIAIFGSRGNMGRRYAAICDYLNIPHKDFEVDFPYNKPCGCDKAIIATPINTHIDIAQYCIAGGMPFLCEKPVATSVRVVTDLAKLCDDTKIPGYMVNNWRYVLKYPHRCSLTLYNYYTGADGAWDMIQPHYYSKSVKIIKHPVFRVVELGPARVEHSRESFDNSYVCMVSDFATGEYGGLMPLGEAVMATKKLKDAIRSGKYVH